MKTLIINIYDSFYGCGVYILDSELNTIKWLKELTEYFITSNFGSEITPKGHEWLTENNIDKVLCFDNGYLEYTYNLKEVG